MLSRNAYSLYWMSRYLERADNIARVINVNTHLTLDMHWDKEATQWYPLVQTTGDDEAFKQRYGEPTEQNVIRFLTFDRENPNSILSCIEKGRENARTVREVIPTEMWEGINALYHYVQEHSRKRTIKDLQAFFRQIRDANHLYIGLTENVMSHNEGWHFARLGRLLECADKTARILDVNYFDTPYDSLEWGAVLKSVSGFKMYCKQYHRANYRDVSNFLIFDPHFPRSMYFCVNVAVRSLGRIVKLLEVSVPAEREMKNLLSMLKSTDIDAVLNNGLHEFIDIFQYNLNVVDQSLFDSFFAFERPDYRVRQSQQLQAQE